MVQNRFFSELSTPKELAVEIGARARQLRLRRGLRQADVAERARLSLATIRRFEATGEASLGAVLRIATVLGVEKTLIGLFSPPPQSIEELEAWYPRENRKRAHRVSGGRGEIASGDNVVK
ncbi:MAG TPA: helix-turn-helix domain-containing protein [Candidatus Baltobacteraceae bacterium]